MDSSTAAERLPFDVLGVVFNHYLNGESIYYPLETMLLVCKAWAEAACGHRSLWGRLRIYLGHAPTIDVWKSRLPHRLERAGDSTLLEIDLRNILETETQRHPEGLELDLQRCSDANRPGAASARDICFALARGAALELLHVLAGPNGALCKRWKSLYLCLSPFVRLGQELSHPTPNLTELCIERICCVRDIDLLPFIPNLRTFRLYKCFSIVAPAISSVQELEIDIAGGFGFEGDINLSNVSTATNVRTLIIRYRGIKTVIPLPNQLPRLHSLTLIGKQLPLHFSTIKAPNLRHLSLKIDDASTFLSLTEGPLPFWDLEELELAWPVGYLTVYQQFKDITSDLLLSCLSLTRIKGERKALSAIVKFYWEECGTRSTGKEYIAGKSLTFWSVDLNRGSTVRRPEGKGELEGVALDLGLIPPSMGWDYMLARF